MTIRIVNPKPSDGRKIQIHAIVVLHRPRWYASSPDQAAVWVIRSSMAHFKFQVGLLFAVVVRISQCHDHIRGIVASPPFQRLADNALGHRVDVKENREESPKDHREPCRQAASVPGKFIAPIANAMRCVVLASQTQPICGDGAPERMFDGQALRESGDHNDFVVAEPAQ